MTRQEVASFVEACKDTEERDIHPYTKEQIKAVNDFIDYLVDELRDKNLFYDTESNYFVYTGPELPKN